MKAGCCIGLPANADNASLYKFKNDLKVGDFALLLLDRELIVGEITSKCEETDTMPPFVFIRNVRWGHSINLTEADTLNPLKSALYADNADNRSPIKARMPKESVKKFADFYIRTNESKDKKSLFAILCIIASSLASLWTIIEGIPVVVSLFTFSESVNKYSGYIIAVLISIVLGLFIQDQLTTLVKKKLSNVFVIILSILWGTVLYTGTYFGWIPEIKTPAFIQTIFDKEGSNANSTEDLSTYSLNSLTLLSTSYTELEEDASTDHLKYTEADGLDDFSSIPGGARDIHGNYYENAFGGNSMNKGTKNKYRLDGQYDSLSFTAFMNYKYRNTPRDEVFNATFFKLYFDSELVYCYDIRNGFEPESIGREDLPSLKGVKTMELEILGNHHS